MRVGYEAGFEVFDVFADAEAKLHARNCDGSPALWRSNEREAYLLYSDPYLQNRLVLVGRADADVTASSLAALPGRKVGIVAKYAYGDEVLGAANVTFVQQPTEADNLRSLLNGEVDYVLIDELVIHNLIERQPIEAAQKIAVGTEAMVERTLHLAVRRDRPDSARIIERFNEAIQAMLADGTYHTTFGVRWIRADVDGDGDEEISLNGTEAGEKPPEWVYRPVSSKTPGEPQKRVEFFVNGKAYESWEDIPRYMSVPQTVQTPAPNAVSLIEFRF